MTYDVAFHFTLILGFAEITRFLKQKLVTVRSCPARGRVLTGVFCSARVTVRCSIPRPSCVSSWPTTMTSLTRVIRMETSTQSSAFYVNLIF